ncbi:MAG: SAM-dependent methyltransferase [Marinilabiliaceae bacterium]
MQGKLYLIPNHLGDTQTGMTIPRDVAKTASDLKYYIVENLRTARRFLKLLDKEKDIDGSTFFLMDKHTDAEEYIHFFHPLEEGHDVGIISEAGCPGVADPGAEIVKIAHRRNIAVVPLTGPSSILLALMASGLNGQNFAFNGYLPIDKNERSKTIKQLESKSIKDNQTQIFIETPYRNASLVREIIKHCQPFTLLCIACDVTLPEEFIKTMPASEWQGNLPELHKRPTVFLLQGI